MRETLNTILLFFLVLAVIAVSRSITRPDELKAEREEIREALARPVLRLPGRQAGLPAGQERPSGNNLAGLAAISYLQRNLAVPAPEIKAQSALITTLESDRTFLARKSAERRPIASITKLMTAALVLDRTELNEEVLVSSFAVETEGNTGGFSSDEVLSAEALLHAMLLESSNDAAVALAEHVGGKSNGQKGSAAVRAFVSLMNQKVNLLGLANTFFVDPVGLDDDGSFSTPLDLAEIIGYLRSEARYRPIWEILGKDKAFFASSNGPAHTFTNNNPFVLERGGIIGGKTGYTDGAGESMVMVATSPDGAGELIYIVLGSTDRFADMRTLINWVASAFVWEKPLSK